MGKKPKNLLLINSVDLIEVEGYESLPTTLYLTKDGVHYGHGALKICEDPSLLNENFKVALGESNPKRDVYKRARFDTASGEKKSAYELSKLYLDNTLEIAQKKIAALGSKPAERILISEPLAFFDDENSDAWISNYRDNLRRILQPRFTEIEFLPEPFAVFQYYRYGLRHPNVAEKKKYFALVIDFGGGTFDISVIETTREGDISKKGRHSKPLSAASVPVGGFLVNRELASEIIMSIIENPEKKKEARKQISNYIRWKSGALDLPSLAKRNQDFIRSFEDLTRRIEPVKIALTRLIKQWQLDSEVNGAVSIDVPSDPFDEHSPKTSFRLTAEKYREVFLQRIWRASLKRAVADALNIATKQLSGRPINVVLISGGSANIRWLERILEKEFSEELQESTTVRLSEDFQHIVSKGLAVECARRKHDPDSEFVAVTYNPIYLLISPDDKGIEIKRFRPITKEIPALVDDGMLLPSATALKQFAERTLAWKVRLDHAPKRNLEYFFMKSSLDHNDLHSRYNIDSVAHTPRNSGFESQIKVELKVSLDGTVVPKFIYKTNRDGTPQSFVRGKPFVIDMTAGDEGTNAVAYIGYDFGSSNSSISYVSQAAIDIYEDRRSQESWLSINELVETLPYPVSRPLRELLSCVGNVEREAKQLITSLEAGLHFSGAIAYAITRSLSEERNTKLFKNFSQGKRSLGPLYRFLQDSIYAARSESEIIYKLKKVAEDKLPVLSNAVTRLNDYKHDKLPPKEVVGIREILEGFFNIIKSSLDGWRFGYFESVRSVPFRNAYSGIFRVAGISRPFFEVIEYTGADAFSSERAYLIDVEDGLAIDLSPFYFWLPDRSEDANSNQCLVFDSINDRDRSIVYTVAGERRAETFQSGDIYDALKEEIDSHIRKDPFIPIIRDLKFRVREER